MPSQSVSVMNADQLKYLIREVPDFPKKGILFYDITTLLKDKIGFATLIAIGLGWLVFVQVPRADSQIDLLRQSALKEAQFGQLDAGRFRSFSGGDAVFSPRLAGFVLDAFRAGERVHSDAELDELTGSFNRRCIMRMLDDEIARAHRINAPCSVALIDLDWFKRINDAYGHPTGDEVLRTFAITVFANIRNIDKFGRYGGEEFLLVLPETPNDAAARILDRLRAIIADLDWSAFSPGMRVTISAGVATLRPNESADSFLARADSGLYTAKARGRNRIASA